MQYSNLRTAVYNPHNFQEVCVPKCYKPQPCCIVYKGGIKMLICCDIWGTYGHVLRTPYTGLWRSFVWYRVATLFFYLEEGGSIFLRNIGWYLPNYMASHVIIGVMIMWVFVALRMCVEWSVTLVRNIKMCLGSKLKWNSRHFVNNVKCKIE